jgi:hypothetical protein
MLAVKKWSEGRPYLIALFAPQMAVMAQDINQLFTQTKRRRLFAYQFPLPNLLSWARLYRSHKKPIAFLRIMFSEFSSFSSDSIQLSDSIAEGVKLLRNNPEVQIPVQITAKELSDAKTLLDNVLKESFRDIESDFSYEPADPSARAAFAEFLSDMPLESSFFFLVNIPCWLLYRVSPTHLYRKARTGDIDALEKLLRLDALMVHDPFIGKQIQALRFNRKTSAYRTILEAPLKSPKAKITKKKMKYAMAGFISALSSTIKQPLTEPEIRSLFDAVAQDSGRGAIDTDLAYSPESFYMAIKRDRDFWLQALDPYKRK